MRVLSKNFLPLAALICMSVGVVVGLNYGVMSDRIPPEGVANYGYLFRGLMLVLLLTAGALFIGARMVWHPKSETATIFGMAVGALSLVLSIFGLVGKLSQPREVQIDDLTCTAIILLLAGFALIVLAVQRDQMARA